MKPGRLRTDPEKVRLWQQRSRKKLPPQSERRIGQRPERAEVVRAALRRDGGCVGRKLEGHRCSGKLDGHERIERSSWPAGYLVLDNVLTVCRGLHGWIHEHQAEARELGWFAYSWERDQ